MTEVQELPDPWVGRPAHKKTQFKPPEPPKPSIPEIPPNYQNKIAQAREYTQQPYDDEPIPKLIGRLIRVYTMKAWEGYQDAGLKANDLPGLRQLNAATRLIQVFACIVLLLIGSTTTHFILKATYGQQTSTLPTTAPISPN